MPTALVTGPTSGIGRGFADAFARKGFDLVLVARDPDRLQGVADALAIEYGVTCETLPADLADRRDVDLVAERLSDPSRPVSALVNNAGFGLNRSFLRSSVDDEQRSIDVMVTAVMRLTHAAIPGMVERQSGMVINVSSIASWITGGTYSAAKSWVTVFSEGLAQDVRASGVRVVAVCPGFVRTEFHARAGIDMSGMPSWMWLDVDQVVDQAFTDLARGTAVSVAGAQYKAGASLLRHGPRALARLATASRQRSTRLGARD